MKITVTMELTQENLSKLRALLPDTEIPGQVSMFDSPSEKPVEPTAEAPKIEDKPITKAEAPMNPRGLVPRGERRMTLWDLKICGLRKAIAAPNWQKSAESAIRKSVILRSVSSSLRISRSKRRSSSRRLSTASPRT